MSAEEIVQELLEQNSYEATPEDGWVLPLDSTQRKAPTLYGVFIANPSVGYVEVFEDGTRKGFVGRGEFFDLVAKWLGVKPGTQSDGGEPLTSGDDFRAVLFKCPVADHRIAKRFVPQNRAVGTIPCGKCGNEMVPV